MRKRQAFEHEHEIRALVWPEADPSALVPQDLDEHARIINVPWPAREFLERIYVSPYAEEWYRDVVASVMTGFAPDLVDRLTWSHMRGVPLY
jgi:hypothetical protein